MYKEFFANMQWTALPLFALVLFIVIFALVIARTWGGQKQSDFEQLASLPLLHDDQPSHQEVNS